MRCRRHLRLLSNSNRKSNTRSSRNASSHESFSRGDDDMNAVKIAALVLIVVGILGLVYGGFSYTKETHEAKLGPIELTVKDKETVNIPVWAGVGAIAIGGVLLLLGGRKS
jgi:preprotein translocase subunit Sss1